jgi:hypothetical protein
MIPTAVMSFNRPHYLRQVLDSLLVQEDFDLDQKDLYFFQDGSVNPFSGREYVSPEVVAECIDLFKDRFPKATILKSDVNLGVALNFERAERLFFETLSCDVAFFLEDDLVLGRHYLSTLSRMAAMAKSLPDLAYFAAYGNHQASREEQLAGVSRVIPMDHNWGFGLTRGCWLASRPLVQSYLDLVRSADYRQRDNKAIASLMHSWGVKCPGTSQDVAKSIACVLSGGAKINTFTCFAKYIGEVGLHSNTEIFNKMGFNDTFHTSDDLFSGMISAKDLASSKEYIRRYAMHDLVKPI